MIASLITLVLAVAPAVQASPRYPSKFPPKKAAPPNDGYKTTYKSHSSSVKCKAVATTYNFQASEDAHVSAVTSAWVHACKTPYYPDWSYSVYKAYKDAAYKWDNGFAFAKAIAVAKTTCRSSGNAWGCAAAYAHAQAWAKATASAHASAWADAVAQCKCDKAQTVAAQADGHADEFKKLVAKVEAVADAHVCVDQYDQYASDYDAQTCVQEIYFHVFAKSISKAVIKGFCIVYPWDDAKYGHFKAEALAEAEATINVKEIKGCVGYVDK